MTADSPEPGTPPDERISAFVSEFFDRRHAGENLTPERFAAEHPDVAEQLQPYLAGLGLIDRARVSAADTAGPEHRDTTATLPTIVGYRLIEEIGRGGMGVVYRALQVSTKRIVALKVMLAGPFASATARRRFQREVELAARLQHPGIVGVLESGDVGGQAYYAMDYVAGVRLDHYLSSTSSDLDTTLRTFLRICDAVEYAHRHGVMHRDLKPANVLIDDDGEPHILDFGLAKTTGQADSAAFVTTCVSTPGQVLGTLFYLSPEQAAGAGAAIDHRTDIYALGVMLFEALTGALPFDTAGRPSQVIQRIIEAPPTPPSSLSHQVNADVETIILKALEKDPQRRYDSTVDFAADIRHYLTGEPILARRPSSLYIIRKKLAKHRLRAGVVAAAVTLALVGLVSTSWSRQRAWTRARASALLCQQHLEDAKADAAIGPARTLFEQHPSLPEAPLIWAQAQYRADMRDAAIRTLEHELRKHPSRWACRLLLAEFYDAGGHAQRADDLRTQAEREAPRHRRGVVRALVHHARSARRAAVRRADRWAPADRHRRLAAADKPAYEDRRPGRCAGRRGETHLSGRGRRHLDRV